MASTNPLEAIVDRMMERLKKENPGKEYYKKQNPDFKVIIRADANQDWRFIEPVLLTCNSAGVRTIDFNTTKE